MMHLSPLGKRVVGLAPRGVQVLGRGILLAGLVGLVAGFGAILFHLMCLVVTHYGMEKLAGYSQRGPENETELNDLTGLHDSSYNEHENPRSLVPWMLIILPAIGGLASGYLVYHFAPEAEGHGTDSAIDSYHNKRGFIRSRVPIVKMFASAITLGTGGSGGREGPIAQIGAGFGSYLATKLKLSDSERRILIVAGLGGGIGAIFHAPLAGSIFACEVLYRDPDFETEGLIPAFISTTVAYSVFSAVSAVLFHRSAFVPLFTGPEDVQFTDPSLLLPLTVLAGAMVIASLLYVRCFYGIRNLFTRLHIPLSLKPALGGMLTGLLAFTAYHFISPLGRQAQYDSLSVLSFGYGYLQRILVAPAPVYLWGTVIVLLVVGLGKIVTTSLTIGSGGSGGVFGPSMVIGGSLGAVIGLMFHAWLPDWVSRQDVNMFVILGMASFFAAAANTPVSTLIMVTELTGSYTLLLPSMWVCALAYMVSRRWTIYEKQVANRVESPAHRGDFIIDLLQGLTVGQALTTKHRQFIAVSQDIPLSELSRLITSTLQTCFPVVESSGKYYGLFSLDDLRQFLYDSDLGPLAVAQDLATEAMAPLTTSMDLSAALSRFAHERYGELPVVDENEPDKVVAILQRQDLISLYDKRLLEMKAR